MDIIEAMKEFNVCVGYVLICQSHDVRHLGEVVAISYIDDDDDLELHLMSKVAFIQMVQDAVDQVAASGIHITEAMCNAWHVAETH